MAFIYKITNDINGKVYIGKTNLTIEQRFKEHCKAAHKSRFEKRPLYSAMNKYGKEHFHIETIEEVSEELSSEREIYWIEKYDSYKNGYNATKGGDGKAYVDKEKIMMLYNAGKQEKEISDVIGCTKRTICKTLREYGIKAKDSIKRANKFLWKPVAKIDPLTNKIITVYPSVSVADRANGNSHNIAKACKNRTSVIQGYRWEYVQISDLVCDDEE